MATSPKAIPTSETKDSKKKRMRSPAYPYINLETAIKRAKEFYDREGRNAAPVGVAAKHWGYEVKSSASTQTAAALMSFGLMQDEGTADKRKVKLTANALKILLDNRADSREKDGLIKQAALAPRVHQQIWTKWGAVGISDENLEHALLFDWEPPFNEKSVGGFIRQYRDTISFAKLSESDNGSPGDGNDGSAASEEGDYVPKVGDYVQWEPNGILRFPEPKRVREICSDGKHALVEGYFTGLPISELTLQKSLVTTEPPQKTGVQSASLSNKLMQEFVVPLSDGNHAVFQWPTTLTKADVDDLKDSLRILERKIDRSQETQSEKEKSA